jgi:cysteine synthase
MQPPGIGRTPVISSPALSEHFGIRHLAIKDESANLFGTHKDRKSLHVVREATNGNAHLHAEVLCILTAGNAGLSLAKIGAFYGVPAIAFVGVDSGASALHQDLESACESVIPLDIEERLWPSDELCHLAGAAPGRRVRDVTNGISKPFEHIVDEICEQNPPRVPDTIVLPVGGGELFLGMADGLKRRGLQTRLIGVTVRKDSVADKLYSKWNPYSGQIDAITNLGSHHRLHRLEDEALLLDTFNWLRSFGLQCEPSSAASFAALGDLAPQFRPDEKVMVINTGTFRST